MRAGMLARQWCEIYEEQVTKTGTGATKTELVKVKRVRVYRVRSRPYTYWQEKRADERFVDWQVELLFRDIGEFKWKKCKVRFNGDLYRVMWFETEKGQTRLLLRMENE